MKPKTKHSTFLENRLRRLLSDLPPTNFSVHPRDYETNQLWRKIHRGNAAVVKSWLPTSTRCGGAGHLPQLQLRRVSAVPPESPAPPPHNHFLRDADSILEAALENREKTSYWCLLERSRTGQKPGIHPPLAVPSQPWDRAGPKWQPDDVDLGPKLMLYGVGLGPNAPRSGLTVTYAVLKHYSSSFRQSPLWLTDKHASIRYECTVSDPFDAKGKSMEFTDLIRCGDKYYAISLQGAVAAMEVTDTRLKIMDVGPTRAVPSSRSSRFFKEYLVEMKGEVLIVYLIHRQSVEVVDDVEVFRLDLDRLDWIKVERLQGKTMFLKETGSEWVESAEFGCRDNCVFFTQGKENKWRVYDFKTCCISSL